LTPVGKYLNFTSSKTLSAKQIAWKVLPPACCVRLFLPNGWITKTLQTQPADNSSIKAYKINLPAKTNLLLATTIILVYFEDVLQKKIKIIVSFVKILII
jgi:hypothetical protein